MLLASMTLTTGNHILFPRATRQLHRLNKAGGGFLLSFGPYTHHVPQMLHPSLKASQGVPSAREPKDLRWGPRFCSSMGWALWCLGAPDPGLPAWAKAGDELCLLKIQLMLGTLLPVAKETMATPQKPLPGPPSQCRVWSRG